MWRDPYSYTLNFTGGNLVPLNGSIGLNVDIDRESDFALYRIAAIHTSPNYRVQIRDQDDRLILGGATPSVNIFGHGQWPYRLDAAKIVRRTNQIRVVLTDASGANNTVRLLFSGANLFSAPPFTIPQFVAVEPFVLTFNYGGDALVPDHAARSAALHGGTGAGMSNGNGRYPGNRFGSPMNDPRQQDPVTTDGSVRSIKRPLGVSTIITRRFALNRAPSISPPADSRYTGDSQRSPQTDLPPWLFPPFGATPLDEPQDRRPVHVAAAGKRIGTIPSTPAGRIGIIRKLGLSSSDMTNTRVTTRSDNDPG